MTTGKLNWQIFRSDTSTFYNYKVYKISHNFLQVANYVDGDMIKPCIGIIKYDVLKVVDHIQFNQITKEHTSCRLLTDKLKENLRKW